MAQRLPGQKPRPLLKTGSGHANIRRCQSRGGTNARACNRQALPDLLKADPQPGPTAVWAVLFMAEPSRQACS